ncbi:MAG: sulfotransferase [Nanoarchaeota archaeon]|nr:sulfotransferase [Nanoarchaeota archaeon]
MEIEKKKTNQESSNDQFSLRNNHRFCPTQNKFQIIFVVGTARSGKSLLSQILGSINNVEYIDEPWMIESVSIMQGLNMAKKQVLANMLKAYTKEMFEEMILLRRGNFKPGEKSTVWDKKEPKKIFERLINVRTRTDVKDYIEKEKSVLLINLGHIIPFIPFLKEVFPECKIIHIIRNGFDVAKHIAKKQWFTINALKQPDNNYCLYRTYATTNSENYQVPWWVREGEEEKFIYLNDFAKGLYYWIREYEISETEINHFKCENSSDYMEIKFEDLIESPTEIVEKVTEFTNLKLTQRAYFMISRLNSICPQIKEGDLKLPQEEVGEDMSQKAKRILIKQGY